MRFPTTCRTVFVVALLAVSGRWCNNVCAATPESKEVKAMVARGLEFLKNGTGGPVGEKVLVALSFYKAGQVDHPTVKSVRDQILSTAKWSDVDVYSLGLVVIFLGELNDQNNLPKLQEALKDLISRQKANGGFGYPERPTGDTSQTQYAVLALWAAKQAGAEVPQDVVEKVCGWLIRTQDPSGGWGYQGVEGANGQRANQPQTSHSLTAAGLGSMCVCADLLGINKGGDAPEEETGLPTALKVVKKSPAKVANQVTLNLVDRGAIDKSIDDGTRWFAKNYNIATGSWNLYYLYGLERCESFRELYNRKVKKEAPWYDDGVSLLAKKQSPQNGSWDGDHNAAASTAFALLFLQRSSRKAIAKVHKDLGEGVLTSGKGLPTDLANASVKRGKLVDSPLAGEVDDVMAMLEDPENPELSRLLESTDSLKLDPNLTKRTDQITKLRSMVSSGSWEARMVAVRAMGRTRDLDSVPSLLFALTDPDARVVQEADTALRFISRKFAGVGLPADPDKRAIAVAREAWRKWYLSLRPDAQLID